MQDELEKVMTLIHDLRTPVNGIIGCLSLVVDGMVDDEAERGEFLQEAQRSALHVVKFLTDFSSVDAISPGNSQLSNEEIQEFEGLIADLQVGAEVLADAISEAIEAIAADPTNLAPAQAALKLALSELNLLNNLLDKAKPSLPVGGYFSTIRTRIRNSQLLILTLEQLGLTVALEADVRGGANQRVRADIVAVLEGEYDIGWSRNPDGSFYSIADLGALKHEFSNIIRSIIQKYEQNVSQMIAEVFRPVQSGLNAIVECLGVVLEGNIENEVERTEFLQRAGRSTNYLLEKINAASTIEVMLSNPPFNTEDQETSASLFKELRADIERIVELMSRALEAIASSQEQIHLLQETHNLASLLWNRNRKSQGLLEQIAAPFESHFSTLRTKITDLQILKLSLEHLGLTVAVNANVRGWKGREVKADVVAVLDGYCDIGWIRREDGSVELIADLWGVAQTYDQTELINSICRQYTQNASSE